MADTAELTELVELRCLMREIRAQQVELRGLNDEAKALLRGDLTAADAIRQRAQQALADLHAPNASLLH